MDVTGSARATLVFGNIRTLEALPTPAKYINTISGLLDDKTMVCTQRIGSAKTTFNVRLGSAPQASLVAPCITASTLHLNNGVFVGSRDPAV